jgi:8-oxo-dGTP diphosphatase
MARGAVVVLDGVRVALIERVTPERQAPYYLFPGGQLEPGETPEQAARREAEEELGLQVQIGRLLAVVMRRGVEQHYYLAEIAGGIFGSGQGEELRNTPDHPKGTYRPVWLECQDLARRDVRPRALAALLAFGVPAVTAGVLRIDD